MDFSRPTAPQLTATNANIAIQRAIDLCAVTVRKAGIQMETDLSPDLPDCLADCQMIEQVLLNLINNATQALADHDGPKRIRITSETTSSAIITRVSDSGSGVPMALRDTIFDPFFTTRKTGSGIGLSLVRRIIVDHGGSLDVIPSIRGGAEFMFKPINMDALELGIANALETIRLRKEVQLLQEKYLKENPPYFIGQSDVIIDIMELVATVAKSPHAPVLILGETGTGKEPIASSIHYKSPHFRGPFVTINCAAIPENLVESELFGYEKGAFSGAVSAGKKSLLEAAADGTLFLDEVGDLSLGIQTKLLRFLENGEYYKVGGTKMQRIWTGVVAVTNRDLETMIEKDDFRQDLYYRLASLKSRSPP